jgi:hypothetical protein
MRIGATIRDKRNDRYDGLGYWKGRIPNNAWMRVFPGEKGLLPGKDDPRYRYLDDVQPHGKKVVFVSTKIQQKYVGNRNGSFAEGLELTRKSLIDLVRELQFEVFYVEHHEPEQERDADDYRKKFAKVYAMKDDLPADVRSKVHIGHALTRQWTENNRRGQPPPGLRHLRHRYR